MSCNRCAATAEAVAPQVGAGSIEANWAGHRAHPQQCEKCGGFVRGDGGCTQCESRGKTLGAVQLTPAEQEAINTAEALSDLLREGGIDPLNNDGVRRLHTNYVSISCGQDREVVLDPKLPTAATDLGGKVFLNPYPLGAGGKVLDQMVVAQSYIDHELLHELYTPPEALETIIAAARNKAAPTLRDTHWNSLVKRGQALSPAGRTIVKDMLNILEDGRIERLCEQREPFMWQRMLAGQAIQPKDSHARNGGMARLKPYQQVMWATQIEVQPNYTLTPDIRKGMSEESLDAVKDLRPLIKKAGHGTAYDAVEASIEIVEEMERRGLLVDGTASKPPPEMPVHEAGSGQSAAGEVAPEEMPGDWPPESGGGDAGSEDSEGDTSSKDSAVSSEDSGDDEDEQADNGSDGTGNEVSGKDNNDTGSEDSGGDAGSKDSSASSEDSGDDEGEQATSSASDGSGDDAGESGSGDTGSEDSLAAGSKDSAAGSEDSGDDGDEQANSGSNGAGEKDNSDTGSKDSSGGSSKDSTPGSEDSGDGGNEADESGSDGVGSKDSGGNAGSKDSDGDTTGKGTERCPTCGAFKSPDEPCENCEKKEAKEQSDNSSRNISHGVGSDTTMHVAEEFEETDEMKRRQEQLRRQAEEALEKARIGAVGDFRRAVKKVVKDAERRVGEKVAAGPTTAKMPFLDYNGKPTTLTVRTKPPEMVDPWWGCKTTPRVAARYIEADRSMVGQGAAGMAQAINKMRMEVEKTAYMKKKGALDRRRMPAAIKGSDRVRMNPTPKRDLSMAVSISVDRSGSMHTSSRELGTIAGVLGRGLEKSRVPYEMRSYTDDHYHHKTFGDRKITDDALASMYSVGGNNDDPVSVTLGGLALDTRREATKIQFVVTDGEPAATRSSGPVEAPPEMEDSHIGSEMAETHHAVKHNQGKGHLVQAVFYAKPSGMSREQVAPKFDYMYGPGNWSYIADLKDLPRVVTQTLTTQMAKAAR